MSVCVCVHIYMCALCLCFSKFAFSCVCSCTGLAARVRVYAVVREGAPIAGPTYGRWMDGFRLGDRLLLMLEGRKGKELIITMAESMSRGAALTFSSLCLATIKKMYQGGGWCLCACACVRACTFVCVCKTQR